MHERLRSFVKSCALGPYSDNRRAERGEGAPTATSRSTRGSSECNVETLEADLWPELFGIVVIAERWHSLRQLEPLGFESSVDVHVRLYRGGFVERSDAHEPEIRSLPVVAPECGLTLGTTV